MKKTFTNVLKVRFENALESKKVRKTGKSKILREEYKKY